MYTYIIGIDRNLPGLLPKSLEVSGGVAEEEEYFGVFVWETQK